MPKKKKKAHRSKRSSRELPSTATLKLSEPSPYDGRPNLDAFEKFVFDTMTWLEMSKWPKRHWMIAIGKFLKGEAATHYMRCAAPNLKQWKVDDYLKDLAP